MTKTKQLIFFSEVKYIHPIRLLAITALKHVQFDNLAGLGRVCSNKCTFIGNTWRKLLMMIMQPSNIQIKSFRNSFSGSSSSTTSEPNFKYLRNSIPELLNVLLNAYIL